MIEVSKNLALEEIIESDCESLFNLMQEIYPSAYHQFWEDKGEWYVNSQYSKENVLKEMSEDNADYYFVVFNGERIGNLRLIWGEKLNGLSEKNQVKLHRIYLHKDAQGNGLGKMLMNWVEKTALQKGYHAIWLDAMDAKPQAFNFYQKLGFKYHDHTLLPFKLMKDHARKMSQLYKLI